IDCQFRRVDGYLWAPEAEPNGHTNALPPILRKELVAAQRAGLSVDDVERAPLPFETGPCLRFAMQAEFHPLVYLRGLAEAIVAGQDHRVGQGDPEVHFPRLEAWLRERFPEAGPAVAHWSGQCQEPHDGMAYIGRLPHSEHVFIVTGDSGNGLTHGVIAGLMM